MRSNSCMRSSLNVVDFFKALKYRRDFRRSHPDYFDPDGILVFCGSQGSGKTLSAVRYIRDICVKYPKCKIISNITLNMPGHECIPYKYLEQLDEIDIGETGAIVFIDEIQVLFGSLESKGISPSQLSIICQQRKRRVHIVGTSQLFSRMAKPFREQVSTIVDCKSILGALQFNRIVDFDSIELTESGDVDKYKYNGFYLFPHTPQLYSMYDTLQKVTKGNIAFRR